MNYNKLKITTYPRIHITLIDMNHQSYRANGGIGFSIESPTLELNFEEAERFSITDGRDNGFINSELNRIIDRLEKAYSEWALTKKYRCQVNTDLLTHFGFGTSTSMRLACLEALMIMNGKDYTSKTLTQLSGRGGTSGIGITTYFNGGFVFDLGVKSNLVNKYQPSSANEYAEVKPLVLASTKLPDWDLGVLIPLDIKAKTEEEELVFFKQTCPISTEEVNSILYTSTYGVAASVYEQDLNTFCNSVNAIQNTAWKKAERNLYGEQIQHYEQILFESGAKCVGMSSLGPTLFFVTNNWDITENSIKDKNLNCRIIHSKMNNNGRRIEYA